MAISTVASEEAKYKAMLKDWVVSFILVFLLQYIIIFTINCNNALVSIMDGARQSASSVDSASIIDYFRNGAFSIGFSKGMGSALVFCILVGVTISFLIFYIKRMLTVAFLIIISPIVTVTYSIDKMGDNKSQALDKWIKEFVYTILIQPFQCLIYLVFAITAWDLMTNLTMGSAILGIVMILFIHQAEDIVRAIFSFEHAHNLGSAFTTLAVASTVSNALGKIGKKSGGSSGGGSSDGAKAAGPVEGTQTSRIPKVKRDYGVLQAPVSAARKVGDAVKTGVTATKDAANKVTAPAKRLANTKAGKLLGLNAKLAVGIAGAAMGMGAAKDPVKGGAIGGALGTAVGNISGNAWHNAADKQAARDSAQMAQNEQIVQQPQEEMATAFYDWVQARGLDPTDTRTRQKANTIIGKVLSNKQYRASDYSTDSERTFAQSIYKMKDAYKKVGISNTKMKPVLEATIKDIQDGNINPSTN